ncbi:MAG: ring-cleaving dioxygenase [Alicyclobacillus sp.]|nr:ring-cleaving dioxygenase [Alicyclobacillus sp.]
MAGVAQTNVDFYAGVLGLRLVKKTVNFDAPDVYHFYYGDGVGRPGTLFTTFPFGEGPRGGTGAGQATVVSFSVRPDSVGYWVERLGRFGVRVSGPEDRDGGRQVLSFRDPDGIALELVAHPGAEARPGWPEGPVPAEHSIRGFHGVTVKVRDIGPTAAVLTELLGFRLVGQRGPRYRYEVGEGGAGRRIDVIAQEGAPYGRNSIGTVHHIAWRVADEGELRRWRTRLMNAGLRVTDVMDRNYFKSVYFREPGGVLFELATDPPGFLIDEPEAALGTSLKLPDWLEPRRAQLEAVLPPVRVGGGEGA